MNPQFIAMKIRYKEVIIYALIPALYFYRNMYQA